MSRSQPRGSGNIKTRREFFRNIFCKPGTCAPVDKKALRAKRKLERRRRKEGR